MKTVKTRECPVCPNQRMIEGWDLFIRHIYENHTEGSADARQMAVQQILNEGPGVREQMIVPKVTAFGETAALWAVMNEDPGRARLLVESMTGAERHEFEAHLSTLMDLVWSTA